MDVYNSLENLLAMPHTFLVPVHTHTDSLSKKLHSHDDINSLLVA